MLKFFFLEATKFRGGNSSGSAWLRSRLKRKLGRVHTPPAHRRSQGRKGAMVPPKLLENIVILCVERRFSKQNSVIRLKSNILAPSPNFCAGYDTAATNDEFLAVDWECGRK